MSLQITLQVYIKSGGYWSIFNTNSISKDHSSMQQGDILLFNDYTIPANFSDNLTIGDKVSLFLRYTSSSSLEDYFSGEVYFVKDGVKGASSMIPPFQYQNSFGNELVIIDSSNIETFNGVNIKTKVRKDTITITTPALIDLNKKIDEIDVKIEDILLQQNHEII